MLSGMKREKLKVFFIFLLKITFLKKNKNFLKRRQAFGNFFTCVIFLGVKKYLLLFTLKKIKSFFGANRILFFLF